MAKKSLMLLKTMLNFLFLFILGPYKNGNVQPRYQERVRATHPGWLCVLQRTERKLLNVCLREREREINWVSGEKLSAESASIKLRRRPPIRWQKERKKGTRIMTERESRMDRRFLCPEFNRIKEQQLYETDRQRGRRPAVGAATVLTITHKYANTQRFTMYHSVDSWRLRKTEENSTQTTLNLGSPELRIYMEYMEFEERVIAILFCHWNLVSCHFIS